MHYTHHEIRAMARQQEQDRLRGAGRSTAGRQRLPGVRGARKGMLTAAVSGFGLGRGGRLRRGFCRVLGTLMRRVGFGLMRSGRRLARIA